MESDATSPEALARAAFDRGDLAEVANMVFAWYGTELYGFLLAQFRGQAAATDEVFSDFSEDFWRALPAFEWRCSIRAWCYKLARSASHRHRRSPHNRRERRIPISEASRLTELCAAARSSTQVHLRSEVKDKIRELRDQLSQEDQDLLTLRIDRDLSWRDVVYAMLSDDDEDGGEAAAPSDEKVRRLEVALRQRFGEVKKRLKHLAEAAGLL